MRSSRPNNHDDDIEYTSANFAWLWTILSPTPTTLGRQLSAPWIALTETPPAGIAPHIPQRNTIHRVVLPTSRAPTLHRQGSTQRLPLPPPCYSACPDELFTTTTPIPATAQCAPRISTGCCAENGKRGVSVTSPWATAHPKTSARPGDRLATDRMPVPQQHLHSKLRQNDPPGEYMFEVMATRVRGAAATTYLCSG